MKLANDKLSLIVEAWNNYFWESRFCQKFIHFDEDVKTNYFGDILHYFRTTFNLLSYKSDRDDQDLHVYNAIGLLQTIYVQQDFIDELLYIFKFDKDVLLKDHENYRKNRNIRNELVGHPIRKDKSDNSFVSSVIWGQDTDDKTIHYILYKKDGDISGEEIQISKSELVESHIKFINDFFDLILEKIYKILRKYFKYILTIENHINKADKFEAILDIVEHQFDCILGRRLFYEKQILKVAYVKRLSHQRYKLVVEFFLHELFELISETYKSIHFFISRLKELGYNFENIDYEKDKFTNNNQYDIIAISEYHSYETSKLWERKRTEFNIKALKRKFSENQDILTEINNIENNLENDVEYFASLLYLQYLILGYKNKT